MMLYNLINISSGNVLLPHQHQAIIWTNADLPSLSPLRTHYSEVIMGEMASQITSLTICLLNRLFRRIQKKISKFHCTGLCAGIHRWPENSPHKWPLTRKQTPRKLFMLCRTENHFFTTFSSFKHGYIKKFNWSSHIFHWASHFFIGRGPRTTKFRGVCGKCFHLMTSSCHPDCISNESLMISSIKVDLKIMFLRLLPRSVDDPP